jgi:hypothetical protein
MIAKGVSMESAGGMADAVVADAASVGKNMRSARSE